MFELTNGFYKSFLSKEIKIWFELANIDCRKNSNTGFYVLEHKNLYKGNIIISSKWKLETLSDIDSKVPMERGFLAFDFEVKNKCVDTPTKTKSYLKFLCNVSLRLIRYIWVC